MCSSGFGRGVGNSCHECTARLKAGVLCVVVIAALLLLLGVIFVAVYLVSHTAPSNHHIWMVHPFVIPAVENFERQGVLKRGEGGVDMVKIIRI